MTTRDMARSVLEQLGYIVRTHNSLELVATHPEMPEHPISIICSPDGIVRGDFVHILVEHGYEQEAIEALLPL